MTSSISSPDESNTIPEDAVVWCPVFHLHQPPYDEGTMHFYRECAEESYAHHLDVLERHPRIKITFNISGILLEQMMKYNPELVDRFGRGVERGQIYLTATSYSHAMTPVIAKFSEDAVRRQIERDLELKRDVFGIKPEVFRPAEHGVSDEAIRIAGEYFPYIITSGMTFRFAGLSEWYAARKYGITMVSRDDVLGDFLANFEWLRYYPNWNALYDFLNELRNKHRVLTDFDGETMMHHMLASDVPREIAEICLDRIYSVVEDSGIVTVHAPTFTRLKPVVDTEVYIPASSNQGGLDTWIGRETHGKLWEQIGAAWKLYEEAKARNLDPKTLSEMERNALLAQTSCFTWAISNDYPTWWTEQPEVYRRANDALLHSVNI